MGSLERWFARAAAKEQRAVFLEDALFGGRFFRYGIYRLRYFFGRSFVEATLHIIEFAILAFIFSQTALVSALAFRTACSFAQDFWWGALECLRARVRSLYRRGDLDLLPSILPQWFRLAILCATMVMVLTVGWILLDVSRPLREFDALHLFLFATALQLAIGFITRTYHSAVYAIRRIYRPFPAIVGVQLCGFLGTLFAWPALGVWSFPLLLIVTTLLANGLTIFYVRRVYRFLRLKSFRLSFDRKIFRAPRTVLNSEFFSAGLSYSLARFDNLVVLMLSYEAYTVNAAYRTLLFFYLVRPLSRACYEWAQLFYFDLKRLELELFVRLRKRFERFVGRLAVLIGLFLGILAATVGTFFQQRNLGLMYLLIMLFFVTRSYLALQQIRAFAERRYNSLIATGLLLVGSMTLSSSAIEDGAERLAALTLMLVFPSVCLGWVSLAGTRPEMRMLSLPDWLMRLKRSGGPVRVRSLSVARSVEVWLVGRIAEDISRSVRALGELAVVGSHRIVWYEVRAAVEASSNTKVVERCAGLAAALEDTGYFESGFEALAVAQREGLLGERVREQWPMRFGRFQISDIKDHFHGTCPSGRLLDADQLPSARLGRIPSQERRDIMQGAIAYSRSMFRQVQSAHTEVTTLYAGGTLRLIFAVPISAPRRARAKWRAFINATNIACALGAEVSDDGRRGMLSALLKRSILATAAATAAAGLWMIPMEDRVAGSFRLQPAERNELRAPINSFLRELRYAEGDWITAGAVVGRLGVPDLPSRIARKLAEIDEINANLRLLEAGPRPELLAVQRARVQLAIELRDRAKADLSQALTEDLQLTNRKIEERQAEVEFARSNYNNAEKLFEANVIHETELHRRRREFQVYEAQYDQAVAERGARQASVVLQAQSELAEREQDLAEAQANMILMEAGTRQERIDAEYARLARLKEELAYLQQVEGQMTLHSTISGIIVTPEVTKKVGRYFEQGALIFEVGNPDVLEAEISLPEERITEVKLGDRVVLKVFARPYQTFEAKVNRILPVIEVGQTENMAKVYAQLERADEMLQPSMSGYARIHLGTRFAGSALLDRFVRFVRTEFWW